MAAAKKEDNKTAADKKLQEKRSNLGLDEKKDGVEYNPETLTLADINAEFESSKSGKATEKPEADKEETPEPVSDEKAEPEEKKPESEEHKIKVQIKKNRIPDKDEQANPDERLEIASVKKKILPPSEMNKEKEETEEDKKDPETDKAKLTNKSLKVEPPKTSAQAMPAPEEKQTTDSSASPTLSKPEAADPSSTKVGKDGTKATNQPLQNPKVYDTKQYNLPIRPAHHKKGQVSTLAGALIIIALLAIGGFLVVQFQIIEIDLSDILG